MNESRDNLKSLGRDEEFTFEDIKQRYLETLISSLEFFCGIYYNSRIIGIIKGRIENKLKKELFIQSFILLSDFRMQGIGSRTLREFERYFYDSFYIDRYCALVMNKNSNGQKFWSRNNYHLARITQSTNEIADEGIMILEKSLVRQTG